MNNDISTVSHFTDFTWTNRVEFVKSYYTFNLYIKLLLTLRKYYDSVFTKTKNTNLSIYFTVHRLSFSPSVHICLLILWENTQNINVNVAQQYSLKHFIVFSMKCVDNFLLLYSQTQSSRAESIYPPLHQGSFTSFLRVWFVLCAFYINWIYCKWIALQVW